MGLKSEMAELCHAIHLFEQNTASLKEDLFNIPFVTKRLIWRYMVGSEKRASKELIISFFRKHGLKMQGRNGELILRCYGGRKDGTLSQDQLWNIFKPLHLKMVDQIIKNRQKRQVLAKCHQTHYKVTDLLCAIMSKTLIFLQTAQIMKKNIIQAETEPIDINPLDAAHLQIFINPFIPGLLRAEVQIVLRHILRHEVPCEKTFKEYFIPLALRIGRVNPNFVFQQQQAVQMEGLDLMKYHWQNVTYMSKSIKNPIYLEQTSSSNWK